MVRHKKKGNNIIEDREVEDLMQRIRNILGKNVLITFKVTARGSKFHSVENFDPDDFEEDEPNYPKGIRKGNLKPIKPYYFG